MNEKHIRSSNLDAYEVILEWVDSEGNIVGENDPLAETKRARVDFKVNPTLNNGGLEAPAALIDGSGNSVAIRNGSNTAIPGIKFNSIGIVDEDKTITFPNENGTLALLTGPTKVLSVSKGGTGLESLPQNKLLYGNGTNQVGTIPVPTVRSLLINPPNNSAPEWGLIQWGDIRRAMGWPIGDTANYTTNPPSFPSIVSNSHAKDNDLGTLSNSFFIGGSNGTKIIKESNGSLTLKDSALTPNKVDLTVKNILAENIGSLLDLDTAEKGSLVAAINSIAGSIQPGTKLTFVNNTTFVAPKKAYYNIICIGRGGNGCKSDDRYVTEHGHGGGGGGVAIKRVLLNAGTSCSINFVANTIETVTGTATRYRETYTGTFSYSRDILGSGYTEVNINNNEIIIKGQNGTNAISPKFVDIGGYSYVTYGEAGRGGNGIGGDTNLLGGNGGFLGNFGTNGATGGGNGGTGTYGGGGGGGATSENGNNGGSGYIPALGLFSGGGGASGTTYDGRMYGELYYIKSGFGGAGGNGNNGNPSINNISGNGGNGGGFMAGSGGVNPGRGYWNYVQNGGVGGNGGVGAGGGAACIVENLTNPSPGLGGPGLVIITY